jgi:hypothetical protein
MIFFRSAGKHPTAYKWRQSCPDRVAILSPIRKMARSNSKAAELSLGSGKRQKFCRSHSSDENYPARTVEELWRAIASFLKGVSKEECHAYLANSGYT